MASETAAGRSRAEPLVESAPLGIIRSQIKNGALGCTTKVVSALMPPSWGGPLNERDFNALESAWITRDLAEAAMLRRVDSQEGREVVAQKGSRDCAGMLIPYYWPGETSPFNYRLRRDDPEWKAGKDGKPKPDKKYLGAPNSGNRLYIPLGVTAEQLADATIPIALVEGEKKALALWRLARHESAIPRFIPISIAGVWNWLGTIGKTGGPKGERIDVHGPIADLGRIAWKSRRVFIVFDANVHTNDSVKLARKGIARELAGRGAEIKLVNLPEDCGVNGVDDLLAVWGPAKVLQLFESAAKGGLLHVVQPPQFQARPEGMFRLTAKGEYLSQVQLSNYRAAITTNIRLDDGVEIKREFEIESELMGRMFRFSIPASAFTAMEWPIEHMGSGAITFPNQKDYTRTAIQSLSMTAQERSVYGHTGWRKVEGDWLFLHASGAIGAAGVVAGVNVRLSGPMNRYELRLPSAPETLASAVKASLWLVELGPPPVSFPLLAATYRSVLGEADFALHVAGETGAFKSEFAALLQQHFGAGMNRLHLPGAWSSTANALEVLAFQAKDTLLVIDDFAPQGSATDIARYHAAADRVFRAAGNRAGRGRLDSTAKLRETKPPRALILSTGEDVPRGHSVRARMLILEAEKGSIDVGNLTDCQRDAQAGLYAEAMGGFVRWMAGRYEDVRASFERRVVELRVAALRNPAHARTPEIVANLQAAFELFLDFGIDCGAAGVAERDPLASRCWAALREAAGAQAHHQTASEPTSRFLDIVRALLSSGGAHLAARDGGEPDRSQGSCGWRRAGSRDWVPLGICIGWVEDEDVYLESTAAYGAVQKSGRDAGDAIAITEQTLRKRLNEKGLLASVDPRRQTLTVRRIICGASKDVLHLHRAILLPDEHGDPTVTCGAEL